MRYREVECIIINGLYRLFYMDNEEPVPPSLYNEYCIEVDGKVIGVRDYNRRVLVKREQERRKKIRKKVGTVVISTAAVIALLNMFMTSYSKAVATTLDSVDTETTYTVQLKNQSLMSNNFDYTTPELSFDELVSQSVEEPQVEYTAYDCMCPVEFQQQIYEICKKRGIDFNVMMCILDNESAGQFNNNGVINSTNDIGYAQINKCNLEVIYDELGYTFEDLQYDDYKSVDAAAFLLQDIYKRCDKGDFASIFGMYNGWYNWRNTTAKNYSDMAMEKLENVYNKTAEEIEEFYGQNGGEEITNGRHN